jgi:hypothetical protein
MSLECKNKRSDGNHEDGASRLLSESARSQSGGQSWMVATLADLLKGTSRTFSDQIISSRAPRRWHTGCLNFKSSGHPS